MARLNASYSLSVQQNGELQAEVDRLQALLQDAADRALPVRARAGGRSATSPGWWQRMVIRKGADYGIPVGAPVVYSGGVVGRVSEVHAYTSVVQLISDPGLRIAAVVEGDTRPISYQGGENQVFGAPEGRDRVRAARHLRERLRAEAPRHLGPRRRLPARPHDRPDRPRRVERGRPLQDGRGGARPAGSPS